VSDDVIRRARPEEAASLSALAMRSKAHWGYDDEFLDTVRPMLTFTEQDITANPVYLLESADGPAGMYRLLGTPPQGTLEDLWLDPKTIGSGYGRQLFEHALRTAAQRGMSSLLIESDPNAEGFYLAMGALRIGERASPSGRPLPLLEVSTTAAAR
jgi:GNAT superfamily N-acetyltransferase